MQQIEKSGDLWQAVTSEELQGLKNRPEIFTININNLAEGTEWHIFKFANNSKLRGMLAGWKTDSGGCGQVECGVRCMAKAM